MAEIKPVNNDINNFSSDVSDKTFVSEVVEASHQMLVLVDFWAPWCGPCKTLGPLLEKEVAERKGKIKLTKVNIDENQAVASQLRVQSIPAVFAFANGQPVDGFMGAQTASSLTDFCDKLIEKHGFKSQEEEDLVEKGLSEMEDGLIDNAILTFTNALEKDPKNDTAHSGILSCYLKLSQLKNARSYMEKLSDELKKKPGILKISAKLDILEKSESLEDIEILEKRYQENPNNLKVKYDLAVALNGDASIEKSIEILLEIYKEDRDWNNQAAKNQLTKIFESLGKDNDLAVSSRRKLSSLMFS